MITYLCWGKFKIIITSVSCKANDHLSTTLALIQTNTYIAQEEGFNPQCTLQYLGGGVNPVYYNI